MTEQPAGAGAQHGHDKARHADADERHNGHSHWQWPKRSGVCRINLALQGGGAHGAFTWGVLDRLLSDPRIEIEAVSGTSAGAFNAIAMADGLMAGGPEAARAKLKRLWHSVSDEVMASPIRRTPFDLLLSPWGLDHNPMVLWMDLLSRVASPYDLNPGNWNPVRDLLLREIDFARVQACDFMRLFIPATNVRTGRVRVFSGAEITAEAIMASSCLPHLFQAVEIDGVPYWDGGYMGNPVLFPFFRSCQSQDVLLVQINPIERTATPRTAREILDRVNEISFNAPLIKELRHLDFINECLQRGDLAGTGYREIFVHRIAGDTTLDDLGATTKLNAEWAFLKHLRGLGRLAAERWLDTDLANVGSVSTFDLTQFRETAVDGPVPHRFPAN